VNIRQPKKGLTSLVETRQPQRIQSRVAVGDEVTRRLNQWLGLEYASVTPRP